MAALTRSTVRAIDAPYEGRWRRYRLRWALVAVCILAFVGFCWAVSVRLFPSGGLGGLVYWLHDTAFLPLKGRAWTQWFPYAFVWLVPLGAIAIVGLTEYLSKAGPVRVLHSRFILRIAIRPALQRLLAPKLATRQIDQDTWSASLSRGGITSLRRSGFARRVIRKEQDTLWMKVAIVVADGHYPDPRLIARLLLLTNMRLRLDPSDAMAHLRALEVIAAYPTLSVGHEFVQTYRRFLEDQTAPLIAAPVLFALNRLIQLPTLDAEAAAALAYDLSAKFGQTVQIDVQDVVYESLQLACTALVVFTLSSNYQLQDVRGFQRLWSAARLSPEPNGRADSLGVAETFIFFEMWSMRAEFGGPSPEPYTFMQRAMVQAGGAGVRRIETAERFAWGGGQQ
jgi:hypothetical protein